MTEYHDEGYLTSSYEPPPWWGEEVQAVVDAAPAIAEGVLLDAEEVQRNRWAAAEGADADVLYPEDIELEPEPDAPSGPTREQAAQRLVAIAALEQLVRKLKAEHREQAAAVYDKAHMKDPVELDGAELGQARTDAVKAAWKVADAGKWLAYVTKYAPAHLVEVTTTAVDPVWQASVLKQLLDLKGEAWFVDPDTGEETQTPPPASGLEYTPAGHKLVVTAAKDAAARVTQLLGPVAQQLGLPELEAD